MGTETAAAAAAPDSALVTGVTGTVGSWVADRLADAGVSVVGVDLDRPADTRTNLSTRAVDLRDRGDTWETIREAYPDAVVHCAADSDLLNAPGSRVFHNNVASTYNTLVGAGRVGAEVVWLSSQAVYGALFATHRWQPDYLPIDEAHPTRPSDPYGTSKLCGELVAEMAAKRYGVPVTTLRAATIHTPTGPHTRPPEEDVSLDSETVGGNFGSYVDVRDVATLVEAVLVADTAGHEVAICAADENYLGPPTAELVESICGDLPDRTDLDGRESALSNAKARERFEWSPRYSAGDERGAVAAPAWV
jgi:nucleoside-diphosphate-sugar epimerase